MELETLELFLCAKEVLRVFEDIYKVKNYMILMNDGTSKSDSPPFCIHILPRDDSITV